MTAARRAVLAAAFALAAVGARAAPNARGDMSLGDATAPVEVVEYASLSCSHCARFHAAVFPAFKRKYVDTGRVRYTLKEMLTPPAAAAAAGFLMARCAGPSRYFKVVDEVFRSQPRWAAGRIRDVLIEIGKANGLTEAQFEACVTDPEALAALQDRVRQGLQAGVTGTPTFFVNGRRAGEGEVTLEQLDAAIAAAAN